MTFKIFTWEVFDINLRNQYIIKQNLLCNEEKLIFFFLKKLSIYFNWRLITLQYCIGFWYTLTWISHKCTGVPQPRTPSHLPPHPIPQGCPSALTLSALFHAMNLDWSSISHMVIYICFNASLSNNFILTFSYRVQKAVHLYLCLFCCLTYRNIITIFLNSKYTC